jgi:hypothetical protein
MLSLSVPLKCVVARANQCGSKYASNPLFTMRAGRSVDTERRCHSAHCRLGRRQGHRQPANTRRWQQTTDRGVPVLLSGSFERSRVSEMGTLSSCIASI